MNINTQAVIKAFGSAINTGKFFGVDRQAVYQWGEHIPELRALQLEKRRPDIADAINQGEYDE